MNHATLHRMHFIDCIVFNYAHISRRPLQEFYGISAAQATRDLRQYNETWPHNIHYNGHTKRWEKNLTFSRAFEA